MESGPSWKQVQTVIGFTDLQSKDRITFVLKIDY